MSAESYIQEVFERLAFTLSMAAHLEPGEARKELIDALSTMPDCPVRRWALREAARAFPPGIGAETEARWRQRLDEDKT